MLAQARNGLRRKLETARFAATFTLFFDFRHSLTRM
jgi:hypothetical protein